MTNEQTTGGLEALARAVAEAPGGAARADACNALARAVLSSDAARALALVEQAEGEARAEGHDRGLAECLQLRGLHAFEAGDYVGALRWSEAALPLCRDAGAGPLEAGALRVCGLSHEALGGTERALECHHAGLQIHRESGDLEGESAALNAIGLVFIALGDHDAATEHFAGALDLARRSGKRPLQLSPLGNIGNMYAEIGDYAGALRCHEEVLATCRELRHRPGEIMALCGVALSLHNLGRTEEADERSAEGLALARSLGHAYLEAHALHGQAEMAHNAGEPDRALPLYRQAHALAARSQNQGLEIDLLNRIGRLCADRGDTAQARATLARGLELAQTCGRKAGIARAHEALAEACERDGDPAGALAHHKTFHALDRDVNGEQAGSRMRARMVLLETAKAQREAELHRLRSVDLADANRALEDANAALRSQAEQLQALAAELERKAVEDGLTGLYNRRHLDEQLAYHFAAAQRQGHPLTAVVLDLDHFKEINDRFGHHTGDAVLRTFAAILRRTCRASDTVGRWGGEEFVLVLPDTGEGAARMVCEKVRRAVETYPWQEIAPGLRVTVSLGLCADTSFDSHERLLSVADASLYTAKAGGRNRVCGAGEAAR